MSIVTMNTDSFLQLAPHLSYQNIIFDLNGVLLIPNNKFFISEIGLINTLLYTIIHRKSPFNILKKLFNFMNIIQPPTASQTDAKYYGTEFMPGLVCEWQLGTKTNQEILNIIAMHIEQLHHKKFFSSPLEKRMISKAAHALFTPNTFAYKGIDIMEQGIEILQSCAYQKNIGGVPKHSLYLLTNFDTETFALLTKKYPSIFSLFKGIMTSAEAALSANIFALL